MSSTLSTNIGWRTKIIAEDREREVLTRRELTAARRKTALEATKKVGEQQIVVPELQVVKVEKSSVVAHRTAAERAAAGLVQPDLVRG